MLDNAESITSNQAESVADAVPQELDPYNVPRKRLSSFGLSLGWVLCPLLSWSIIFLGLRIIL
ncbi:hypothetical protein [Azospirillum canadense]|uniref:hypothetical protein n=1 Tax=Azospirillum canadense TaxID=403962 RepID=UPI0022267D88|nr:hypothetical protein [Azospirillum canadense]MCW2239235.1 hypothetical protein [Azospirillum canadense]